MVERSDPRKRLRTDSWLRPILSGATPSGGGVTKGKPDAFFDGIIAWEMASHPDDLSHLSHLRVDAAAAVAHPRTGRRAARLVGWVADPTMQQCAHRQSAGRERFEERDEIGRAAMTDGHAVMCGMADASHQCSVTAEADTEDRDSCAVHHGRAPFTSAGFSALFFSL
jgi:hypothetical protein